MLSCVHTEVPVLQLQGLRASPGPNVPSRTSGRCSCGTAGWQTELQSSRWRGSSCCLQLQTPEEEEELLFPWKHNHVLRSRSSSVWTVPARQPGKDAWTLTEIHQCLKLSADLCCIPTFNSCIKNNQERECSQILRLTITSKSIPLYNTQLLY